MPNSFRLTSLIAAALLVMSLLLSACDVLNDDDDDAPELEGTASSGLVGQAESTPTSTAQESTGATATEAGQDNGATAEATASAPESGTAAATEDEASGDSQAGDLSLVTAVERVTEQVRPAVAFIAVTQVAPGFFGQPEERQGVGSGVIFDEEGHILTNNHVVEGAEQLQVALPDGRKFEARVVGRSPANDLAVIQIDGDDLPVAELGSSGDLEIGQWVVAIGNALGLSGGSSVTAGVVSALDRTLPGSQGEPAIGHLIQTDAAINPGNSGGPLLNLEGKVVGINTAKIAQAEGIGFAVPIDIAKDVIDQILNQEPQAALGVTVATITPEIALRYDLAVDKGVLVVEIDQSGAAAEAGFQPGDIITAFEGTEIANADDLSQALREHRPGDEVSVTVNRDGQEQQVEVTLGESVIVQ